jgi:hypothetical protein
MKANLEFFGNAAVSNAGLERGLVAFATLAGLELLVSPCTRRAMTKLPAVHHPAAWSPPVLQFTRICAWVLVLILLSSAIGVHAAPPDLGTAIVYGALVGMVVFGSGRLRGVFCATGNVRSVCALTDTIIGSGQCAAAAAAVYFAQQHGWGTVNLA